MKLIPAPCEFLYPGARGGKCIHVHVLEVLFGMCTCAWVVKETHIRTCTVHVRRVVSVCVCVEWDCSVYGSVAMWLLSVSMYIHVVGSGLSFQGSCLGVCSH